MTIGDTLKALREAHGYTMDDVARKIGVTPQTIYKYESGVTKNIPLKNIEQLGKLYGVQPEQIVGWDNVGDIHPISSVRMVPILGAIACGAPIWADQNYDGYFALDSSIRADFILYAKGNSMIDADIRDGDKCFMRRCDIVDDGKIAAVLLDDSATLKRVYHTTSGWILRPENKEYAPIVIDGDIKILGELVGVFKTNF